MFPPCKTSPKGFIYRFSCTHVQEEWWEVVCSSLEFKFTKGGKLLQVSSQPVAHLHTVSSLLAAHFPCVSADLVNPLKWWRSGLQPLETVFSSCWTKINAVLEPNGYDLMIY